MGIETKDFKFHSLEEVDKNMKKAKVDQYMYMKSKNRLNSLYGMMVTKGKN